MKRLAIGMVAAAALAFSATAQAEIKIALDSPPDLNKSGTYVWAHNFTEALKRAGLDAKEYARNSLGEEAERLDQVSQGLLEVSMSDVKQAGKIDKMIFGIYLPCLFENIAHVDRAAATGLLAKINTNLAKNGVRILALVSLGPAAGIFNTKKEIKTVGDMASLRMRALDEHQIALYKTWGTTGTIVSWSEVPNALQTGVADGYLNPSFVPLMFGHTDFIKFFTNAQLIPSTRLALVSNDWYNGLSAGDRAKVDGAAAEATKINRAWIIKQEAVMLKDVAKAGIKVTELTPAARAEFVKRSRQVWTTGALEAAKAKLWVEAADKTR